MKQYFAIKSAVTLLALVFFFACSKSKKAAGDAEIPSLEKECLSGRCVKGQFETAYQRFALITGHMVNLRSRPAVDSRVIMRLPVTRKVTLLYVKPEETTIGGIKGRWVFVRDAADLNIQGWLFDHFIGNTDCFKKADKWGIREIRVILAGTLTIYKCRPGGRFDYRAAGPGKKKNPVPITGDILQCSNVIWLKKDKPDDYPIFFQMLKNGNIELSDQYKDKRGIVITNR
jgi:hypothetical protein